MAFYGESPTNLKQAGELNLYQIGENINLIHKAKFLTRISRYFYPHQSSSLAHAFYDFSGKIYLDISRFLINISSFVVVQSQIYKLWEKLRAKSHLFILAKA